MANYIILYGSTSNGKITRRRSIVANYDHIANTYYYLYGISWTGSYLITSHYSNPGYIIRSDGYSPIMVASVYCSEGTMGVTWDGSNLIHTDGYEGICRHFGFSSSKDMRITPAEFTQCYGVTWASGNLIGSDVYWNTVDKYAGFSSSYLAHITVFDKPIDVTWAGSNLVVVITSSSSSQFYIFKYSGFSSTIIESCMVNNAVGWGIEWDNHVGQASIPPGWSGTWGPIA